MPRLRDCPLLTRDYAGWDSFVPARGSLYFYRNSGEPRTIHPHGWQATASDVSFVEVRSEEASEITVIVSGAEKRIRLRSAVELQELVRGVEHSLVYLDITGLSHHVWAPLLKAAWSNEDIIRVVYVEPAEYKVSQAPTAGQIFDLSEDIIGLQPLPGFTSLAQPWDEEAVCFVPLLGFEGARLAYVLEQVQPPAAKVYPTIGVPGFRPEYPFYAYLGNKNALEKSGAWQRVRFAIANCPFSLFYVLQDLAGEHPRDLLKIAPIGTRPHALGAVLYTLLSKRPVELIYDHPKPKPDRTTGVGKILVYDVSALGLTATRD